MTYMTYRTYCPYNQNHKIMRQNILAATLLGGALAAAAAIPQGYYDSLNGKSGASLREAAKQVAAAHTAIEYGEPTWEAFKTTDVRIVDGREAWFDMYSNVIVWVATGHSGMNIEHSVPNSWWGGIKNDAYKDLYHLNPSNADANNRKSNHPLSLIDGLPSWTNGISSIGSPVPGQGGGSATVFEPADQYKGDFARAYFYVFTIYNDIPWIDESDKDYMYLAEPDGADLRPWAYDMLLQWAEQDPVDSRELARNEAVSVLQGNRNPFIDIPDLADYIWGARKETVFDYTDVQSPLIVDRPAAPVFESCQIVGVDTYTSRWWNAAEIVLGGTSGRVYVSIDGGDWEECQGMSVSIPAATANGEQLLVSAYALAEVNGVEYTSPLSTLTLTAKDPSVVDLTSAEWTLVEDAADLNAGSQYVVVAPSVMAVMADSNAGGKFMPVAGNTAADADGRLRSLPEGTGVVTLLPSGDEWVLQVSDLYGAVQGCIAPTAARSLKMTAEGVPASLATTGEGTVRIDYGTELGTLQYNASSPRFLNYTSSQQPVALYRLSDTSSVGAVTLPEAEIRLVDGTLRAPAGSLVFDLSGRLHPAASLSAGVYIVVTPSGHHAKIAVR